jgi:hypothetical protein
MGASGSLLPLSEIRKKWVPTSWNRSRRSETVFASFFIAHVAHMPVSPGWIARESAPPLRSTSHCFLPYCAGKYMRLDVAAERERIYGAKTLSSGTLRGRTIRRNLPLVFCSDRPCPVRPARPSASWSQYPFFVQMSRNLEYIRRESGGG